MPTVGTLRVHPFLSPGFKGRRILARTVPQSLREPVENSNERLRDEAFQATLPAPDPLGDTPP